MESVVPECWWVANAMADQTVSNTQNHASRFEINRMNLTPPVVLSNLDQLGSQRN